MPPYFQLSKCFPSLTPSDLSPCCVGTAVLKEKRPSRCYAAGAGAVTLPHIAVLTLRLGCASSSGSPLLPRVWSRCFSRHLVSTGSTIPPPSPPPKKTTIFVHERFMGARHEEGCHENIIFMYIFLFFKRTIVR